jgi:hypothetical protein
MPCCHAIVCELLCDCLGHRRLHFPDWGLRRLRFLQATFLYQHALELLNPEKKQQMAASVPRLLGIGGLGDIPTVRSLSLAVLEIEESIIWSSLRQCTPTVGVPRASRLLDRVLCGLAADTCLGKLCRRASHPSVGGRLFPHCLKISGFTY